MAGLKRGIGREIVSRSAEVSSSRRLSKKMDDDLPIYAGVRCPSLVVQAWADK
jgi:hypothetical protein